MEGERLTPGPKNTRLPESDLAEFALPPDLVARLRRSGPQAPGDAAAAPWKRDGNGAACRGDGRSRSAGRQATGPRTHAAPRIDGPFLKGPIPMQWLRPIYQLCPGAIVVAVELCWLRGMVRAEEPGPDCVAPVVEVDFNLAACSRRTETTEKVLRAGLQALEGAGLIFVTRPPGKRLVVTFRDHAAGVVGRAAGSASLARSDPAAARVTGASSALALSASAPDRPESGVRPRHWKFLAVAQRVTPR
jgi:hypothetical protein